MKRLFWLMVLVTVVAGAGALFFFVQYSLQNRDERCRLLIKQMGETARSEFENTLGPTVRLLEVTADWGADGLIDLESPERSIRRLKSLLEKLRWISSMRMVSGKGTRIVLEKDGAYWVSRTEEQEPVAAPAQQEFAPGAADKGGQDRIQWDLDQGSEAGVITGRITWDSGGVWSAAYVDLEVGAFEILMSRLGLGSNGDLVWMNRDGEIIRLRQILGQLAELRDDQGAVEIASEELTSVSSTPVSKLFSVEESGVKWWVGIESVHSRSDYLPIAVIVPEAELLATAGVRERQRVYLLFLLSGLGLAGVVFISVFFLRKNPEMEPEEFRNASEERLRELIRTGEGERSEFKSSMRWNIQKDRPGKEVEFSWLTALTAFMNTDGGTLLIGVNDDGQVVGIEADRFPNEDRFLLHFNNLVKEHIGLEFTSYLAFEIRTIDEYRVLVADCRRSEKPAFLKKGRDESFFIRVGPGSRKLSASEMLDYLSSRNS